VRAASQLIDDFFPESEYSQKSKNNHAHAASVDEGHFGSVCTLDQECRVLALEHGWSYVVAQWSAAR
jgi:hypothetical protein